MDIMDTLAYYKATAENKGMKVHAIALKGSQNYNLHDEESDIDANLVFIPTLQQLRTNFKDKLVFGTGEVTCHNIYSFADIAYKGNPQWIEICNSDYIIGDLDYFKKFNINPSAIKGMMMEKIQKLSHITPSTAQAIEKYGFIPKELHHIIRLAWLLASGRKVDKCHGTRKTDLIRIKRGLHPNSKRNLTLQDAQELITKAQDLVDSCYSEAKESYTQPSIDYDYLDSLVLEYYKSL